MKKILMLVSGVMLSSSVFATPLTAGGSTGSTTTVGATTGTITCAALSTDTDTPNGVNVKVGLSKENIGDVICSATDVGVSVASTKGKAKMYSVGSGGGSEVEGNCAASPCVNSDTSGAAQTALDAAS